jgi:hypothetical protein
LKPGGYLADTPGCDVFAAGQAQVLLRKRNAEINHAVERKAPRQRITTTIEKKEPDAKAVRLVPSMNGWLLMSEWNKAPAFSKSEG